MKIAGAFSLIPLGHRAGPCATFCDHEECGQAFVTADSPCVVCQRPNGFGVPIYANRTLHGHAACIDSAYDVALKRFLSGLARMAAKYCVEHNIQPPKEWMGTKPKKRKGKKEDPEEIEKRPLSPPYLTPEYLIHTMVPVGRSGRGKKPVPLD